MKQHGFARTYVSLNHAIFNQGCRSCSHVARFKAYLNLLEVQMSVERSQEGKRSSIFGPQSVLRLCLPHPFMFDVHAHLGKFKARCYSVLHCNLHSRKTRKVVVELMSLAFVTRRASITVADWGLRRDGQGCRVLATT
jgi:hypothetical protein